MGLVKEFCCLINCEDDEEVILPVPVLDENGKWNGVDLEKINTTKDEYFDLIRLYLEQSEERRVSLLEAFTMLDVCPHGFVNEFAAFIVALESDAATYHILPSGGGIYDEEQWLMEAFRSVRKARDDYYIWDIERKKRK